jgi:putative NADH-flavin reductase
MLGEWLWTARNLGIGSDVTGLLLTVCSSDIGCSPKSILDSKRARRLGSRVNGSRLAAAWKQGKVMRFVIFGATGGMGHLVVEGALARGDQVTALERTPAVLEGLSSDQFTILPGNARDPVAVQPAVRGQQAVVIAVGVKLGSSPEHLFEVATRNIIQAMHQEEVRRLLCVSTWLVGAGQKGGFFGSILLPLALRDSVADWQRQEELVQASELDWTIIRPATLTNGTRIGTYRAGPEVMPGLRSRIARADVADFILRLLADDTYSHQTVGISY